MLLRSDLRVGVRRKNSDEEPLKFLHNNDSFEGYLDASEVILKQFNKHAYQMGALIPIDPEEFAEKLRNEIRPKVLNVLIKSDFGRGFLLGFIYGQLREEAEEDDDAT